MSSEDFYPSAIEENQNAEIARLRTELLNASLEYDRLRAEIARVTADKTALAYQVDHFVAECDRLTDENRCLREMLRREFGWDRNRIDGELPIYQHERAK